MKKLLYTLLALSIIFSACEEEDTAPANTNNNGNNNNNTGNNTNLQLGDFHEGGIIFWLDVGGSTGLVVSYEDIGDPYWSSLLHNWSGSEHHEDPGANSMLSLVANSTGFGSGMENTTEIVNANLQIGIGSPNNAADNCYYSTFQGYTDWYLPSKDELNQLYLRKDIIESAAGVVPFSECYWSSSASDWVHHFVDLDLGTSYWTVTPWAQYFLSTNQYQAGQAVKKNSEEKLSVRPIRVF
jgi:hypothetical protein